MPAAASSPARSRSPRWPSPTPSSSRCATPSPPSHDEPGEGSGRPWDESEREAVRAHPHLEEEIRGYRTHFALSLVEEIAGTAAILRELHVAGIPVLALTNWSAETVAAALEAGLDAIHFADPEHLRHDLVLRGLPVRESGSPDLA